MRKWVFTTRARQARQLTNRKLHLKVLSGIIGVSILKPLIALPGDKYHHTSSSRSQSVAMSRPTITVSKFVGTIGLGLLTGVSYTLSTATVPALLALPSAPPAHATFLQLRTLTSRHQVLLSTLSTSSLILAYVLSPPRGKHPYLLWASFVTALGFGSEIWGYVTKSMKRKDNASDDGLEGMEEWEVEDGGINGEALREGMEKWRGKMGVKAGVWGLAWGVSMIGLWGDRF